jgi:hypothetical protein
MCSSASAGQPEIRHEHMHIITGPPSPVSAVPLTAGQVTGLLKKNSEASHPAFFAIIHGEATSAVRHFNPENWIAVTWCDGRCADIIGTVTSDAEGHNRKLTAFHRQPGRHAGPGPEACG